MGSLARPTGPRETQPAKTSSPPATRGKQSSDLPECGLTTSAHRQRFFPAADRTPKTRAQYGTNRSCDKLNKTLISLDLQNAADMSIYQILARKRLLVSGFAGKSQPPRPVSDGNFVRCTPAPQVASHESSWWR